MLENAVAEFGYVALLVISFGAATLLPFASEPVVVLMVAANHNWYAVLACATIGNYLGALFNYYLGARGADYCGRRFHGLSAEATATARQRYARWGAPTLFFSWLPVVGDPLTVVAGAMGLSVWVFTLWVLLGKGVRYAVLILITRSALNI